MVYNVPGRVYLCYLLKEETQYMLIDYNDTEKP